MHSNNRPNSTSNSGPDVVGTGNSRPDGNGTSNNRPDDNGTGNNRPDGNDHEVIVTTVFMVL